MNRSTPPADGRFGPGERNWNANARKEPQKHANQSPRVSIPGEPMHSINLRFARPLHRRSVVICGSLRAFALRILRFHPRIGRPSTQGDDLQMEPLFLVVALRSWL